MLILQLRLQHGAETSVWHERTVLGHNRANRGKFRRRPHSQTGLPYILTASRDRT